MAHEQAPTTGGYYFDRESGVLATVRRNVRSALSVVSSGDAGRQAIGVALGFVAATVGRALWHELRE